MPAVADPSAALPNALESEVQGGAPARYILGAGCLMSGLGSIPPLGVLAPDTVGGGCDVSIIIDGTDPRGPRADMNPVKHLRSSVSTSAGSVAAISHGLARARMANVERA